MRGQFRTVRAGLSSGEIRNRDREVIFLGLGALGCLLAFLLRSFTEFNAHIPANALWFTVLAALALKALSSRMAAPDR